MKKGFTLVELSIVLVVIGLLIGGILVGQSLIQSAKINSIVKQLASYDVLMTTFKTKYGYYPGDYPKNRDMGVQWDGNGDGVIPALEGKYVWEIFYNLKWTDFACTGSCYGYEAAIPGTSVPTLEGWGKDVGVSVALSLPYDKNSFIVGKGDNALNFTGVPFISSVSMLAFDKKVDDGLPYGGDVKGRGISNECVTSSGPYNYVITSTLSEACAFDYLYETIN